VPRDLLSDRVPPSGEQHRITHGDAEAHVTQVGATLRSYTVAGTHVLDGFDESSRATDGRGQVLAPWPNRIAGGRYDYGGHAIQAPLNEPARGNAIHGLVRWSDWTTVDKAESRVGLTCAVRPQPGYDWTLLLEVVYHLEATGLTVELAATNTGLERAPFGAGFHPYLRLGEHGIDDLRLCVPAEHRVITDDGSRSEEQPVGGTEFDLRKPRRLGGLALDTAYGALDRDEDGRAVVSLAEPDGSREVRLWVDEAYRYLMVYTGDEVGDPGRRRQAVAVEPMSCPPQAFRTGTDFVELEPGETWRGRWGIVTNLDA